MFIKNKEKLHLFLNILFSLYDLDVPLLQIKMFFKIH